MPDVPQSAHPAVIWAGVIIGIAVLVAWAVPRVAGPLRDTVEAWGDSVRRAQAKDVDADLVDLSRQVATLQQTIEQQSQQLAAIRHYQTCHDDALTRHRAWDVAAMETAARGAPCPSCGTVVRFILPSPTRLYPDDEATLPPIQN